MERTYTASDYLKALVNRVKNYRDAESAYYQATRNAHSSSHEKRQLLKNMLQEQVWLDEATLKIEKEIL